MTISNAALMILQVFQLKKQVLGVNIYVLD